MRKEGKECMKVVIGCTTSRHDDEAFIVPLDEVCIVRKSFGI